MSYTNEDNTQGNREKLLQEKDDILPSIISSFKDVCKPEKRLEDIKNAVKFLEIINLNNVEEELLKHVMPVITETLKEIYQENYLLNESGKISVLKSLEKNLQIAIFILEPLELIFKYVIKYEPLSCNDIQSFPINVASILFSTFEHCKNSQTTFHQSFKSINEIVELFKKAQVVHTVFLDFLNTSLNFNFCNENELLVLKEVLNVLINISEILSGINVKSMADNWKTFNYLTQKYSNVIDDCFDISLPLKCLVCDIKRYLQEIIDMPSIDTKKAVQNVKVVGFLIKVALKLFETYPNVVHNNFDDILHFCTSIYKFCPAVFKTYQFPNDFIKLIGDTLFSSLNTFVEQIFHETLFIMRLSNLNNCNTVEKTFGHLHFYNEFLKRLPELFKQESHVLKDFCINLFLETIFDCLKVCNIDFFLYCEFYEELITNISVATLIFASSYYKVEQILFKSVAQNEIWTAMLAMDCWCLILRFSSLNSCQTTLNFLLSKLQALKIGTFTRISAVLYLRILTQRLFKLFSNSACNEEIYNHEDKLLAWKILGLQTLPSSHRFQVEFVLNDLLEKENYFNNYDFRIVDVVALIR